MARVTVWTKQHESVAETLKRTGRYTAKRDFVIKDLQEHAALVLEVYDWLTAHTPNARLRPADAEYPIWVSPAHDAVMLPSPHTVILELSVDPALITKVNIGKWGAMLNYAYIPSDAADAKRHKKLLEACGVSDAKAFMSRFYPQIKQEIEESWDRLFDDSILLDNDSYYGNLWEVRQEWVTRILR